MSHIVFESKRKYSFIAFSLNCLIFTVVAFAIICFIVFGIMPIPLYLQVITAVALIIVFAYINYDFAIKVDIHKQYDNCYKLTVQQASQIKVYDFDKHKMLTDIFSSNYVSNNKNDLAKIKSEYTKLLHFYKNKYSQILEK